MVVDIQELSSMMIKPPFSYGFPMVFPSSLMFSYDQLISVRRQEMQKPPGKHIDIAMSVKLEKSPGRPSL